MSNVLWTIYLGLLGTVSIGYLIKGKYKTNTARLDFLMSIITWTGLFGYVTNTQIFTALFWQIIFFAGVAWDFIYGVFWADYGEEMKDIPVIVKTVIIVITLIIFVGPLYYGLYRYAFLS